MMGGRNKYKNNNKPINSNRPIRLTQVVQAQSSVDPEQIISQMIRIRQPLMKYRQRLRNSSTEFAYLVSYKWLASWKIYTGYDALSRGDNPEQAKGFGKKKLSKFINDDLLAKNTVEYFKIPERMWNHQFLNTQIIHDGQNQVDFIVVDQELWMIIQQYYPLSITLKRPLRRRASGQPYTDAILHNFSFFVVTQQTVQNCIRMTEDEFSRITNEDKRESIGQKQVQIKRIRISGMWSLPTLRGFIQQLLFDQVPFQDLSTIQFWKMNNYLSFKQIKENVISYFKGFSPGIKGVDLRRQYQRQCDIQDFIKSSSVMMVVFGNIPIARQFAPVDLAGYCQFCLEDKKLQFSCYCNEVFYCSRKCQYDDKQYHFKSCQRAYDSDDDEEFKIKTIKTPVNQVQCGLNNLGNTCYMNSSLQSLCNLNWFYQYFAQNKYIDKLDQSQLERNNGIFIHKFAKFVKKISQYYSYSPYSLKSQISYFISILKGYSQHDANDFILYLLTTLNDFSTKQNGQAFSQFILQNLTGKFNSTITCPECKIQSVTQDVYLQVSLPIKSKILEKQIPYVKIKAWNFYEKGAVTVTNWKTMCEEIGVDIECRRFIGNEGGDIEEIFQENVEEVQRRCKRQQLLFIEYLKPIQNAIELKINLTYVKIMIGVEQKSDYGYPIILQVDRNLKLYQVYQKIGETIQLHREEMDNIYELKAKIEKDMQDAKKQREQKTEVTQNQQKQPKHVENSESKESNITIESSEQNKRIEQKYVDQLYDVRSKIGFKLEIVTKRKKKKPCNYCKKKCFGCLVPFSLITTIAELAQLGQSQLQLNLLNLILDSKFPITQRSSKPSTQNQFTTISQCLQQFCQPQQLDQQNAWYCEACDMMRLAEKRLTISQYSKTLILQLKRFKEHNGKKVKNNEIVWYPKVLEIKEKNIRYQLNSVIIHEGSLDAGHYWAICRKGNDYWQFNDDQRMKIDNYIAKGAYILIYEMIQ